MNLIKKMRLLEEGDVINVETKKDKINELLVKDVQGDLFNSEVIASHGDQRLYKLEVNDESEVNLINSDEMHEVVDIEPSSKEILVSNVDLGEMIIDKKDTKEVDTGVEIHAENVTILGDCPACGCVVVKENIKAICTSCNKRCSIAQWKAFEGQSLKQVSEM